MIFDIWTLMQKEWKELLQQRGRARGGALGVLVFIGVLGILMPMQFGREWVESPSGLILAAWLPFLLVTGVIADSFAGERERHTLETLLASRLSDRAILFGKAFAALVYGLGLTTVSFTLGLITTNVVYGKGELILYPFDIAAAVLALSLLGSLFASSMGVLVSLRASTVRQAQQIMSLGFMVLFVPMLAFPALPDAWKGRLILALANAEWQPIVMWVSGLLALIDAILIAAAMARFKRAKLILD